MLKDKVIVVTGASRGIGEAIARACVEGGARVALASRKQADLERVAGALPPERAIAVACHTGKAEEVDALFARTVERFGRVDGLVNNAATNPYFGPLVDTPDAAIDKTIEVNLRGYLYCARALVRQVRKQTPGAASMSEANRGGGDPTGSARGAGGTPVGSIVNVASVAGLRAAPMQGIYGMTKAAVISMTQTLAFELGGSQIRVNAIAPGLVETKFAAAIVGNPMLRDHVVGRTPLARHAQPAEIAGAAVYLLSDAASFTTGTVLVVDGGLTAT
jgi:NAD(P)-dependent dehydrogenase (short-subunit alcohol dehydrogenase family)